MPLDADDKATGRIFDGLDHSIVSECYRTQVAAGSLNSLMMIAVHFHFPTPCQLSNQAVFRYTDHMPRGRFTVIFVMRDGRLHQGRDILDKRASAIHVEALNTETNAQYRHVLL